MKLIVPDLRFVLFGSSAGVLLLTIDYGTFEGVGVAGDAQLVGSVGMLFSEFIGYASRIRSVAIVG